SMVVQPTTTRNVTTNGKTRRMLNPPLPRDAVVFTVIARSAPKGVVSEIEFDCIDRSRGPLLECFGVAHPPQLAPHPRRRGVVEQDPPRLDVVTAERAAHLEG